MKHIHHDTKYSDDVLCDVNSGESRENMQRTVVMADGYEGVTQEERTLLSHIFDMVVQETCGTAERPQDLLVKQGENDDIGN